MTELAIVIVVLLVVVVACMCALCYVLGRLDAIRKNIDNLVDRLKGDQK